MNEALKAIFFLAGFISVSVGVLVLASYPYHRRAKLCLEQALPVDPALKKQFQKQFGLTDAIAPSVSLFDVLYHSSKLDPHCLEGISHLHHAQNFENLSSVMSYLHQEIVPDSIDGSAWRGMIHKYKGYTGEEVEFDHLREAGHHVVIPQSATHPDYDALVDGHPYNVKITDNPAEISKHLREHPDIDVITNREMSAAFVDNPHVHIDATLSSQDAFNATDATFQGVDGLGHWLHHIPMITLVASSIHHGTGVVQGRKSITDAAKQTGIDVGAKGFGALGGSKLGLFVGLCLAPATGGLSAVAIPAMTTLAGSIVGMLTGKKIGNWFKSGELRLAQVALKERAASLKSSFETNFDSILCAVRKIYSGQDIKFRAAASNMQNWLERLLTPTVMTKFYLMARRRTKAEQLNAQMWYTKLRTECKTQEDETAAGLIIYAQGREAFSCSKVVQNSWDRVNEALHAVEHEKARLA